MDFNLAVLDKRIQIFGFKKAFEVTAEKNRVKNVIDFQSGIAGGGVAFHLTVKLFLRTTDTISLLVCIGIEEDMGRVQT